MKLQFTVYRLETSLAQSKGHEIHEPAPLKLRNEHTTTED